MTDDRLSRVQAARYGKRATCSRDGARDFGPTPSPLDLECGQGVFDGG